MNSWLLLAGGWAAMALVMAALWGVQRARGDAGIVDVAWTCGVALLGVAFTALSGAGEFERKTAVVLLVLVWGARLASHVLMRLFRSPDGRYESLKENWGAGAQSKLFWFFQIQAFWAVLFAAPILLAVRNPSPFPGVLDVVGLVIGVVSIVGEATADAQLSAFRRDPANKGRVCQTGLWRYSRHPNYFFEWLHWWAYVGLAWSGPWGWLSLGGPACMLLFLFKVTGIPPTEAQSLKSRGEAYREYQRTTSVFVPWPPK